MRVCAKLHFVTKRSFQRQKCSIEDCFLFLYLRDGGKNERPGNIGQWFEQQNAVLNPVNTTNLEKKNKKMMEKRNKNQQIQQ